MHELRSQDASVENERATLRALKKRDAEVDVVQLQKQVVAETITSLEQTRRSYHMAADKLSRLLVS